MAKNTHSTEESGVWGSVRPWGSYLILHNGDGYQVKKLIINPGEETSLQRHKFRTEQWLVVTGKPVLELEHLGGMNAHSVEPGVSVKIRSDTWHRIKNPTNSPVEIIEVWLGEDLRENDIERKDDKYGRS